MTTPLVNRSGPITVDGTDTTATFPLPLFHGGGKLHFGNITGLTGTISASWDGTTFTNIISNLQDGTLIAAGGTVTAADDAELFFQAIGATHVRFTRTAGSGPIKLVATFGSDGQLAALMRTIAAGGASLTVTQPDAIIGSADPTIDSYSTKAISASANTANQELVAAPGASKQIWVYGWGGSADTGDGSISFQDSDDAAATGVMPVVQNGGFAVSPSGNFAQPVWKIATNKALEIDTVTCGFKGWLSYAIVSV